MKFVLFIISIAVLLSVFLVGGILNYPNTKLQRSATNIVVTPNPTIPAETHGTLQLRDFTFSPPDIQCQPGGKAAVHLLLDNSTSMDIEGGKKMRNLKAAVIELANNLADTDVLGVQLFNPGGQVIFPIDLYSQHKPKFETTINKIKSNNGTPTESRLRSAKTVVEEGFARFPGYIPTLIMFTDGCPNPGQKPVPVAEEIRNEGIRIIVVGIELGNAGKCDKLGGAEGARQLMEQIAPSNYYDAADSNQLPNIMNLLKESLNTCNP